MPDLRLPVGLFFLLSGIVLVAEGILRPTTVVGIAMNLDWGIVIFVFGVLMTFFGWRAGSDDIGHDESF